MATTDGQAIALRLAVAADLPALIALDREARNAAGAPASAAEWLAPEPEAYLRNWVAAGECFVATTDGDLAGYAVLHYHFFHSGIIDLVIVRHAYRRRGIGRALVRHLAGLCTSPRTWISTNLSNTPMQALLAAEGFAMCGFIEGLDEGDPELVYSKPRKLAAEVEGGEPG